MKKLFLALTVAGLGTMLVSVSAQAGGVAFDAVGNLFVADTVHLQIRARWHKEHLRHGA